MEAQFPNLPIGDETIYLTRFQWRAKETPKDKILSIINIPALESWALEHSIRVSQYETYMWKTNTKYKSQGEQMNQEVNERMKERRGGEDWEDQWGPWVMLRYFGVFCEHWRTMSNFWEGEQFALESPVEENSKSSCNKRLLEKDLGAWLPLADCRNNQSKTWHLKSDTGLHMASA